MTSISSNPNAFAAANPALRFGKQANPALRFGLADTGKASEAEDSASINKTADEQAKSEDDSKTKGSSAETPKTPEPTARQKHIVQFFQYIVPAASAYLWKSLNPMMIGVSLGISYISGNISRLLKSRFDAKAFREMESNMKELHDLSKEEAKGNADSIAKFVNGGADVFAAIWGSAMKSVKPYLDMLARSKPPRIFKGVFNHFQSAISKAQAIDPQALKNTKFLSMLGPLAMGVNINLTVAQEANPATAAWKAVRQGVEFWMARIMGGFLANNKIASLFGFGKK